MPVGIKTVLSSRTPVQSRQGGSGTGALLAVCLGFFVIQLDVTIVNVALPTIQRGIAGSVAALQWIVDAYTLALAAILLTAGRADAGRSGRVRGRDRAGLVCYQPSAAEQERVDVRCSACDEAAGALVDNGGQARPPPAVLGGMLWTIG